MTKYNLLITGANGQLGSEIKDISNEYLQLQFTYTDIDELDITNGPVFNEFVKKERFEYIINCAAYTAVDKAESEPEKAHQINLAAVKNMVATAAQNKIRFIHISTDYVFDGKSHKPYTEKDIPNPQSVYGISKLKGEEEALKYENSLIIRTSWLYSAYGNNFVKTMLRLGKEKKEVRVVSDQAGSPTYAKDLATAILHIVNSSIDNPKRYTPGIYHYSNEGICSWYDFAVEIMEIAGISCTVIPIETREYPTPAKRPFYSVLNKKKIKDTFQIPIPYWKDSLKKCITSILTK